MFFSLLLSLLDAASPLASKEHTCRQQSVCIAHQHILQWRPVMSPNATPAAAGPLVPNHASYSVRCHKCPAWITWKRWALHAVVSPPNNASANDVDCRAISVCSCYVCKKGVSEHHNDWLLCRSLWWTITKPHLSTSLRYVCFGQSLGASHQCEQ